MPQGSTIIVLATGNRHKVKEIGEIFAGRLSGQAIQLKPASDYPDIEEPEETGTTFEANAVLKAVYWAKATGHLAMADDSGLVVDALEGRPGVYSARYDSTSERRNQRVLDELKGVPGARRTARFVCVAALADPTGSCVCEEGRIEGKIVSKPRGEGGFGYDPIFQPMGESGPASRTLAEYPSEEKHAISHRGKAFDALVPHVERSVEAGRVVSGSS